MSRTAMPVISAETFIIPIGDGNFIVYAPLRRAAFVATPAVVHVLSELHQGRIDGGVDASLIEFLRMLEIVDGGAEDRPVSTFTGDPAPAAVTLFLTTACNLRCTYCYASAGDTPTKFMTLDIAKRGIDFAAKNAIQRGQRYFEVSYHGGGEPTVNWRVMTESLDYARHLGLQSQLEVRASAATNGVLKDEQIDWIIENMNGVSLSFDGIPDVQDRNRPTVTGQPSSTRVLHTMRRFENAGYPYGLRLTITADQIHRLPESIDFICANFSVNRIQVEPAYKMGRWSEAPTSETEEFIAAFREAYARAATYGRKLQYSAARVDTLTNHFCGVTQDLFALSPDGNVSACFEVFAEDNPLAKTFFYGKPQDSGSGFALELQVVNELRKQSVDHRDYCSGCFAKWHCAGDCYHKSLTVNGPGEFEGSERCHITRELTKDQILERIAESGGLFWRGTREG